MGKKPIVAPYSGAILAMVARSHDRQCSRARTVELDKLPDDLRLAQELRER